jgi:hypothetical protein
MPPVLFEGEQGEFDLLWRSATPAELSRIPSSLADGLLLLLWCFMYEVIVAHLQVKIQYPDAVIIMLVCVQYKL